MYNKCISLSTDLNRKIVERSFDLLILLCKVQFMVPTCISLYHLCVLYVLSSALVIIVFFQLLQLR